MKRLLFVDHASRILGGAEINLSELLDSAPAREQWQMACACPPSSPLSAVLAPLPVKLHDYALARELNELRIVGRRSAPLAKLRGWRALSAARARLAQIISEWRPQAVVSCTNKDHFCAGPVCRRAGVVSCWWVNDIVAAPFFSWPVRRYFLYQARRYATHIVTVSDYSRRALLDQGLPAELVRTIHNGIPLGRYRRQTPGTLQRRLNTNGLLVGMVGRFTPWKGQELFLRVARRWVQSEDSVHFVLVGQAFNEEQAYEAELRRIAAEATLQNRVHFVGFQVDIAGVLSDLDVLVHASTQPEPFGRVVIEAMAVGTPTIAARDGGVPEIITDGVNGRLVMPGDEAAYLGALHELLDSGQFRARLAAAGRETVAQRFTVERVQQQFQQLLVA